MMCSLILLSINFQEIKCEENLLYVMVRSWRVQRINFLTVSESVYLSVKLFACPYVWSSVSPYTCQSVLLSFLRFVRPYFYPSVLLSIRSFVRPSFCRPVRPFIRPSFCPSALKSIVPSVRLFVRFSVCPSIHLFVSLSVRLHCSYVCLSTCVSVHLSISRLSVSMFDCESSWSACLSIRSLVR